MPYAVLVDLKEQRANEYTFIMAAGYTVICQQTKKQLNWIVLFFRDLFSDVFFFLTKAQTENVIDQLKNYLMLYMK